MTTIDPADLDAFERQLAWIDTMTAGRTESDPTYVFTQGLTKHAAGAFATYRMRLTQGQYAKADAEAASVDRWLAALSDELHQLRRDPVLAETADLLRRDLDALRPA